MGWPSCRTLDAGSRRICQVDTQAEAKPLGEGLSLASENPPEIEGLALVDHPRDALSLRAELKRKALSADALAQIFYLTRLLTQYAASIPPFFSTQTSHTYVSAI